MRADLIDALSHGALPTVCLVAGALCLSYCSILGLNWGVLAIVYDWA